MPSCRAILITSGLALLMLCAGLCGGGYALFRHLTAPRVIVWDLSLDHTTAAIGWTPTTPFDLEYVLRGDLDFTLLSGLPDGSVPVREFHERCFMVGCSRKPLGNELISIYAHFARNITVDEAVPIAKRVLTKWSGGLRDSAGQTPPGLDDWHKSIQAGIKPHREESYIASGANGGSVRITLLSDIAKDKGRTRCTLTFSTF